MTLYELDEVIRFFFQFASKVTAQSWIRSFSGYRSVFLLSHRIHRLHKIYKDNRWLLISQDLKKLPIKYKRDGATYSKNITIQYEWKREWKQLEHLSNQLIPTGKPKKGWNFKSSILSPNPPWASYIKLSITDFRIWPSFILKINFFCFSFN